MQIWRADLIVVVDDVANVTIVAAKVGDVDITVKVAIYIIINFLIVKRAAIIVVKEELVIVEK